MKKYIYGIISTSKPVAFGQSLLSSSPEEVFAVVHRELAGVVSNYRGDSFASLSKEDKLRCLMTYQGVIERVMEKGYTILPVKFGTIAADYDEINSILEQGYEKLTQTLDQMDGVVEIEVVTTWNLEKVLEEIGREEEFRRLKRSIAGKPVSEILEIQINAGKLVKEYLDRRRERYYRQTIRPLAEVALDMQPNVLLTDEMVMNVAFLLRREKQKDFERRVMQINEAFVDRLSFRVIGPLPPYSFSTVEIKRPDPGKIEEARRLLDLGTEVSGKELKEAYRHLAARSHPDAHLDGSVGGEHFTKVRESFVLLRDYCLGQSEDAEGNSQRHSLVPKDIRQTFLVEPTRPALQTG